MTLQRITEALDTAQQPWTREQAREAFVLLGWGHLLEPVQEQIPLKREGDGDQG